MKGADNETIGFGGWPHSVATVDAICEREDLTRSQLYRRSITEYLKKHNVDIITGATSADPNSVFFQRWQGGANEGGM